MVLLQPKNPREGRGAGAGGTAFAAFDLGERPGDLRGINPANPWRCHRFCHRQSDGAETFLARMTAALLWPLSAANWAAKMMSARRMATRRARTSWVRELGWRKIMERILFSAGGVGAFIARAERRILRSVP